MQRKNWIFSSAILILLAASMVFIRSSASGKTGDVLPTCCKKSLQPCKARPDDPGPSELIMENVSHQFISFSYGF